MLRLDTQYDIYNLIEPQILKVLSVDDFISHGLSICAGEVYFDDILLLIEKDQQSYINKLINIPFRGVVLGDAVIFNKDNYQGIVLENPIDRNVVKTGDVLSIYPRSPVARVLYRRGSNSNLLFVTDRCNSRCLMCSQPPKEVDDEWHIQENLKLIDLMDKGEEQIGISGGEPTIYGEGLLNLIAKAKEVIPEKSLHLLSNGRLLSDTSWIQRLKDINHPDIVWGIPLYADTPREHDYIVQAQGAFSETIQGIYNLAKAKQLIEIRVVLSSLTVVRLPQLSYYIFRNMPFICHVAFMGIESMGLARKNRDLLWIDPADYQAQLKEASYFLYNRGIPVSIYNLPLCILDKSLTSFYQKSISDWKNLYIDVCEPCQAKEHCGGFFKSHSSLWQSEKLKPMTDYNHDIKQC